METALSTQLRAMLQTMGVTSSTEYDSAHEVVAAELFRIKVPAVLESLRHGELVLSATPRDAALLRLDAAALLARLEATLPGVVTSIRIAPRRS
jgi:hypothetical protein